MQYAVFCLFFCMKKSAAWQLQGTELTVTVWLLCTERTVTRFQQKVEESRKTCYNQFILFGNHNEEKVFL